MGRKKFIDKKNGAHYRLVFRESSDASSPAERIFVRTDKGEYSVPGFSDGPDSDANKQTPQLQSARNESLIEEDFEGDSYEEESFDEESNEDEADLEGVLDDEHQTSNDTKSNNLLPFSTEKDKHPRGRSVEKSKNANSRGNSISSSNFSNEFGMHKNSNFNKVSESARMEIIQLGLVDDGYDYTQHLRTIGGKNHFGSFIPALKPIKNLEADIKVYDSRRIKPKNIINEDKDIGSLLPSNELDDANIEIRTKGNFKKFIDQDVFEALENSEGSSDELEDDFVLFANSELDNFPQEDEEDGNQMTAEPSHEFEGSMEEKKRNVFEIAKNKDDYDVHVEEDTEIDGKAIQMKGGFEDLDRFDDAEEDEFDDGDVGYDDIEDEKFTQNSKFIPSHKPRENQLIDEQFEKLMMDEYNDDDYENFSDDVPENGKIEISEYQDVFSEFLNNQKNTLSLGEIRDILTGKNIENSKKSNIIYINKDEISDETLRLKYNELIKENDKRRNCSQNSQHSKTKNSEVENLIDRDMAMVNNIEDSGEVEMEIKFEGGVEENADVKEDIKWWSQRESHSRQGEDGGNEVEEGDRGMVIIVSDDECERERFDCESVISTLSNLDNHPALISADDGGKKKKHVQKLESVREEGRVIKLFGRSQLPLEYLDDKNRRNENGKLVKGRNEEGSVNERKVENPRREETSEEKKLRKSSLKEERRNARMAKKSLGKIYREEGIKGQAIASKSIIRAIHLP